MDQTFANFLMDMIKSGSFDNYELFLVIGVIAYFLRGTNFASLIVRNKAEPEQQEDQDKCEGLDELKREMKARNTVVDHEIESLHNEHLFILQILKEIRRLLKID